jgi:hypothetical protein
VIDSLAGLRAEHRTTWLRLQQLEAAAAGTLSPGRGMDAVPFDNRAAHQSPAVQSGL